MWPLLVPTPSGLDMTLRSLLIYYEEHLNIVMLNFFFSG
jgi:hypothetical protein